MGSQESGVTRDLNINGIAVVKVIGRKAERDRVKDLVDGLDSV